MFLNPPSINAMLTRRKGETVIDLGSGAGFDVFLAAKKVGASGRVIGIDMNLVCFLKPKIFSSLIKSGHARSCEREQGQSGR